jgi:hypothetical protein
MDFSMSDLDTMLIVVGLGPTEDHDAPCQLREVIGGDLLLCWFCRLLSRRLEDEAFQELTFPELVFDSEVVVLTW